MGTSLSQDAQATAHQRNADNRVVATRVFDATTPADGTDIARINRAFGHSLGDITAQLIGWTLSEGQRDSALKR